MSRVTGRQAKGSERIRNDIRCGCKVFTGCSSEVHNALNTCQHILRFPTGHCHVIHSFGCFGCGKLRLRAHLAGFITKGIKVFSCRSGNRCHLTHRRIEVSGNLHSGSTNTANDRGDTHHLLTGTSDRVADIFHLATNSIYFFKLCIGSSCLFL